MKTKLITTTFSCLSLLAISHAAGAYTQLKCGPWDFFCMEPLDVSASTLPITVVDAAASSSNAVVDTVSKHTNFKRVAQAVETDAIDYVKKRTQTPSPRLNEAIAMFRAEAQRRCEESVANRSDGEVSWAIIRAARADDAKDNPTQH